MRPALFVASLVFAVPALAAPRSPVRARGAERALNARLDQKLHETLRRLLDQQGAQAQKDASKATLLTRR